MNSRDIIRKAWYSMIRRCSKDVAFYKPYYYDKGITVCDKWIESFESFYQDMLPTWQLGLELDRKDNDKGYFPDNCRWVTHSENQKNKRAYSSTGHKGVYKNKNEYIAQITINGKTKTIGRFKTIEEARHARQEIQNAI